MGNWKENRRIVESRGKGREMKFENRSRSEKKWSAGVIAKWNMECREGKAKEKGSFSVEKWKERCRM